MISDSSHFIKRSSPALHRKYKRVVHDLVGVVDATFGARGQWGRLGVMRGRRIRWKHDNIYLPALAVLWGGIARGSCVFHRLLPLEAKVNITHIDTRAVAGSHVNLK